MNLIWVTNWALAEFSLGLVCPLHLYRTSSKEHLPEQIAVTHLIARQGHSTSRIYRSSPHMNYSEVLPVSRGVHSSAAPSFVPDFVCCWLRPLWAGFAPVPGVCRNICGNIAKPEALLGWRGGTARPCRLWVQSSPSSECRALPAPALFWLPLKKLKPAVPPVMGKHRPGRFGACSSI